MYLQYGKNQRLPIILPESKKQCDITISDGLYKIEVNQGDGKVSTLIMTERELKDLVVGNPQPCGDNDYYEPTCPFGNDDCICDPAYITAHYPEWYKKLGSPTECKDCINGERYDDEDK